MASFLSQIAKITDNLFLSSFMAATETNLNKHGITCVITVCKEVPRVSLKKIDAIKLDVLDRPNECLIKYFDSIADKIKEVSDKNGKTLVHCVAGVSRSTTMVLAYLMKHGKMMLRDAHDYVKSRRPFIRPNLGFWKQLVEYELKLYGRNSVRIIPSNIGFIPDIYENEIKNMIWSAPPVRTTNSSGLNKLTGAFTDLSFGSSDLPSTSAKLASSAYRDRDSTNENSTFSLKETSPFKLFSTNPPPPLKHSASYQQLSRRSGSPNMTSMATLSKTNSSVFNEPTRSMPPFNSQYTTTYRTSFQKHA